MTKFLKQFFVNISQKALFVTQKAVYFTQKSQKSQNFYQPARQMIIWNTNSTNLTDIACSAVILEVPQKSQKWQKSFFR